MFWLTIDRVLSRLQTASDCNEKSSTCRPSCQPQNTKILNSECDRNVYNTGISTLVVPATSSQGMWTRFWVWYFLVRIFVRIFEPGPTLPKKIKSREQNLDPSQQYVSKGWSFMMFQFRRLHISAIWGNLFILFRLENWFPEDSSVFQWNFEVLGSFKMQLNPCRIFGAWARP